MCLSKLSRTCNFLNTRATNWERPWSARVPSRAVLSHRKHACLQIHPGQLQAVTFSAASAPDLKQRKTVVWQKCCWSPFSGLFQNVVLWCIVLSWVFPWFGSVSSQKMNMEIFFLFFFLCLCLCARPSSLQLAAGFLLASFRSSRLHICTWVRAGF